MMLRRLITTAVLALLVPALFASGPRGVPGPASAGKGPAACIPLRGLSRTELPFGGGERQSFVIHYKWGIINADVASATLSLEESVLNGEPVFAARIFGQNARKFDPVFKMREDFRSWFSADSLAPRRFTRDTREGNYYSVNDYAFDRTAGVIRAELDSRRRGPRTMDLPLTDCTFDVVSLFYYARNLDFSAVQAGRKYPLTFAVDDDICNIFFIYRGIETLNIKGVGKVRTRRFTVRLASGEVFGDDAEAAGDMWFTDDDNRLLVWFDTPIKVGHVYGRITGWDGLKHPFGALVEPSDQRR